MCPARGIEVEIPSAISGSSPIVTNSVVPMPIPPRTRAARAMPVEPVDPARPVALGGAGEGDGRGTPHILPQR